ncbi:MAG: DbpA RNA binding domain-containing protein [Taibaiella sp.]|nr:DbpA RNA binding domain-containing protein [Taibaiella sp.]
MAKFKNRQLQVIVATDVAARGIDVNDISHVINYELPDDPEVYTHRSGRTARAGKTGICISISTPREIAKIRRIERMVNSRFEKKEIPSGGEVIKIKILSFLDEIREAQPDNAFEKKYISLIQEELQDMTQEELLHKLLWMQLNPSILAYKNANDLNVNVKEAAKAASKNGTVRLFINLGKKDGLSNKKLADFIADSVDFDYKSIDRVTVTELSSYFNVPADTVDYIVENLSKQKYNGRKLRVDEAEEKSRRRDRGEDRSLRSGSDRFGSGGERSSGRRSSDEPGRESRKYDFRSENRKKAEMKNPAPKKKKAK